VVALKGAVEVEVAAAGQPLEGPLVPNFQRVVEDAAAALAWTFKHVTAYGGDRSKVFVLGISAGSYLGAMITLDKSYLAKHGIDANDIPV